MAHTIHLSDAAFQHLQDLAQRQALTPEKTLESLIASAWQEDPFFETEDWFRHLGMTDEMIQRAKDEANRDAHP